MTVPAALAEQPQHRILQGHMSSQPVWEETGQKLREQVAEGTSGQGDRWLKGQVTEGTGGRGWDSRALYLPGPSLSKVIFSSKHWPWALQGG